MEGQSAISLRKPVRGCVTARVGPVDHVLAARFTALVGGWPAGSPVEKL
jgi:hypothetical protein